MFIESNNKDAYCAHMNFMNVRNSMNSRKFNAFMNISQLNSKQIWDMRLNKYLRYESLKALKSVSVILYKLSMYMHLKKSSHKLNAVNKEFFGLIFNKLKLCKSVTWDMIVLRVFSNKISANIACYLVTMPRSINLNHATKDWTSQVL